MTHDQKQEWQVATNLQNPNKQKKPHQTCQNNLSRHKKALVAKHGQ
jgi:hypothetical protein